MTAIAALSSVTLIHKGFKNTAAGMAARNIIKTNFPTYFKESRVYAKVLVKF